MNANAIRLGFDRDEGLGDLAAEEEIDGRPKVHIGRAMVKGPLIVSKRDRHPGMSQGHPDHRFADVSQFGLFAFEELSPHRNAGEKVADFDLCPRRTTTIDDRANVSLMDFEAGAGLLVCGPALKTEVANSRY